MDGTKGNEVGDGEEGAKDELFFIGDSTSSEGEINFSHQNYDMSCKQAARLRRESSPPLLLAFPISSGRSLHDTNLASSDDLQGDENEDSDQSIEEWMILDEEGEVDDSNIQLNLSYGNTTEDESRDEDTTDKNVKPLKDIWAVSEKDKSLANRYFVPGQFKICHICSRTGHLAKSCCFQKKCPTCVLCGTQGHIQRDCPGRPCTLCGMPCHGLRACDMPPVWNQHCQRCGITGHISDACPDTWRQYHLTTRLEVPHRPQTVHNLKRKRFNAHCYNCSEKGHHGYECSSRRMVSGTFPSVPYVCCYDTMQDILQRRLEKEHKSARLLPHSDTEQLSEKTGESGEDKGRSKTKQEASTTKAGRRKTWPERRRERREVKRLRREAHAMREGRLLGRARVYSDDEDCLADPLRHGLHCHKQSTPPPQRKNRKETGGRKSKKHREAERWMKRRGIKRGVVSLW